MRLRFITGNKFKLEEARVVFPVIEQLEINLTEIQEMDAKIIIAHKLNEALLHHQGQFMVEDTSLHLDALNGLPGPLIKLFLQVMGNNGITTIAEKYANTKAVAKTWIGYVETNGTTHFFEGSVSGTIVPARGNNRFSWDPIFVPEGYDLTFSEMDLAQKNSISMRGLALQKLRDFLME